MVTRMEVLTAFVLTLALAQATPFISPDGGPTNDTSLFPPNNTTTKSTYLPIPPLQLAKLNGTSSSVKKGAKVYSQGYAIFNGLFAVMICLAIVIPLGICVIWYVTRAHEEKDVCPELAVTDFEGQKAELKPSFPMRVSRRLGKEKVVG